jgi:protein TonB
VRVSEGVQAAKLLRRVLPEYPRMAKAARIQGVVQLIAVIARDGTIQELRVVSGHHLLAPAAVEAVRQWVYWPTLLSGVPVEVIAPIEVRFQLFQ